MKAEAEDYLMFLAFLRTVAAMAETMEMMRRAAIRVMVCSFGPARSCWVKSLSAGSAGLAAGRMTPHARSAESVPCRVLPGRQSALPAALGAALLRGGTDRLLQSLPPHAVEDECGEG